MEKRIVFERLVDLDQTNTLGVFIDESDTSIACLISTLDEEQARPHDIFQEIKSMLSDLDGEIKTLKKAYLSVRQEGREISIAKITGDSIYILCANGCGAFVVREDSLVPLIKTSMGEYLTISGKVRTGDTFLFATHEVIANLPLDLLLSSLKNPNISDSIKEFEPSLDLLKEGKALIIARAQSESDNFSIQNSQVREHPEIDFPNAPKSTFKTGAISLIDKILSNLPQKRIRVEENEYAFTNKKKFNSTALVGLILLSVLGVSIYFGLKADQVKKEKSRYEPRLEEAQHNLGEAKEIAGLSPTRAQELILSAQDIAYGLKNEGVEDERLENLLSEINQNLGPIAGIYADEPQLFIDLSLISSGFKGTNISFSGDSIRVLDRDQKKLVGIEIGNKRTTIIAGSDYLPDAIDTISYEGRSFILSKDGIREVTDEVNLSIKADWDAQKVIVKMFAGNMYVLDRDQNQIWRYPGTRESFLEKTAWLGDGIVPDFSKEDSMAIDGSIWTISRGEISNYSLSVPTNFSVTGLRGSMESATKLFTSDETSSLYVLDPTNSRVVVISKDGQYKGEYTNPKISQAQDFIVSESDKKIIFLSDSKLYSIELKHI